MRAAFGVEAQVFALRHRDPFQTSFDRLLDSAGRNYLVKYDSQLSVAAQSAAMPFGLSMMRSAETPSGVRESAISLEIATNLQPRWPASQSTAT